MLSDKIVVRNLVEICWAKGVRHVVLSPGSRNAPLSISFNEHGGFKCYAVPDERVAGFFALGIAQQTRRPVVVSCTSGSALLNLAPAIVEAYYQKVPLLIVTADRPLEWIEQGINQTIQQAGIYAGYVKKSYQLPQEATGGDDLWYNDRIVSEAIDQTTFEEAGPVHLNLPFREPLYNRRDYAATELPKVIEMASLQKALPPDSLRQLAAVWNAAERKLVLCGQMAFNEGLNEMVSRLAQDPSVAVLTEPTANLHHERFNPCLDRLIAGMETEDAGRLQPDLLLTFGGAVVSNRIKAVLRNLAPKAHWHIAPVSRHIDTYQVLTRTIPIGEATFLEQFLPLVMPVSDSHYAESWKAIDRTTRQRHETFLSHCPWSDLKAFAVLLPRLPVGTNLHFGNSTPVRYGMLFDYADGLSRFNANRGVSGIDGCTSTAAGAAAVNGVPTTIVTGDMGFFYDSNAFWNHHLSPNFRTVVINNGGGNIFRYIPGPDTTRQLEQFFEAHHDFTAEHLAKAFRVAYYAAASEAELVAVLPVFYGEQAGGRPAILEIHTPRFENDRVLKAYFQFLAQHSAAT